MAYINWLRWRSLRHAINVAATLLEFGVAEECDIGIPYYAKVDWRLFDEIRRNSFAMQVPSQCGPSVLRPPPVTASLRTKPAGGSLRVSRSATTLRTQTLMTLRRAIVDGRLQPGERLVERDLCIKLGVSRTLVREALRSLETEGLVLTTAHRGPAVITLTAIEAAQVYQAREAVEGMACQIFAARATSADMERLAQALAALTQALAANNRAAALGAKTRFYDALMSGAGNPVLHDMASQLRARAAILRASSMSRLERTTQSLIEMRAIADALHRRHALDAHAACIAHLRNARDAAIAQLAEKSAPEPARERPPDKRGG